MLLMLVHLNVMLNRENLKVLLLTVFAVHGISDDDIYDACDHIVVLLLLRHIE
jgi:hypothetical protein